LNNLDEHDSPCAEWILRFDLSDEEWLLLEPLLPKSRKRARVADRKIMNAIFYVLRTGNTARRLRIQSLR
jgi:transposase